MTFDEFLNGRLAALLRFAVALSDSRAIGADLVERAFGSAQLPSLDDPDSAFAAVRAWVVRGYLSKDMRLGQGSADDVDTPLVVEPGGVEEPDELGGRLARSSKLQRATLRLRYAADLSDADIARTVGSTPDGVTRYLDHVLAGLGGAGPAEDELRDRLSRLPAVDESDVTALRRRIVDQLPAPEPEPEPEPEPAGPSWRRRKRWILVGPVVAVVIAVAVTLVVVRTRSDPPRSAERGTMNGLPSPVGRSLPGTSVLVQFSGAGSTTIHPGHREPSGGHVLALALICRGTGPVSAGPLALATCAAPVVGQVDSASIAAVPVRAPGGTKWRVAVVDQPVVDSNGSLSNPPDRSLTDPHVSGLVAAARGSGPATVALTRTSQPGPTHELRISLLCKGVGVTLTSSDGSADGKYTRSCFAGWSYEFDVTGATLPGTLHVAAGAGTTWQLSAVVV